MLGNNILLKSDQKYYQKNYQILRPDDLVNDEMQ